MDIALSPFALTLALVGIACFCVLQSVILYVVLVALGNVVAPQD